MSKWFRGIRVKLLSLVLIPTILIVGICSFSYYLLTKDAEYLYKASVIRLPIATYSGEMQVAIQGSMRRAWAMYGTSRDPQVREQMGKELETWLARYSEAAKKYEAMPRSDRARDLYKEVPPLWSKADAKLREAKTALLSGTREGDERAVRVITEEVRPITAQLDAAFEALDDNRMKVSKEETEEAISSGQRAEAIMAIIAFFSTFGLLFTGLFWASRLAKTFGETSASIAQSAAEVGNASQQLSNASQTLSSEASEAAASLEETVASIEELSSMVKLNSDNSQTAGALSSTARTSAEQGEQEMRVLTGAMREISESSKKIEEIINVIDDIAFQTNLLALNAAVEAARAGEQGKGFAVVAEAVRNLAQRSGAAAKDINSLIKESVDRVERGTKVADKAGDVLREIVGSVKKVADLTQEIASASSEQANGLEQISKAMNQLDQATQGNASSAEETAAASEELSAEAESLRGLVADLMVVVEGHSGGGTPQNGAFRSAPQKATVKRSSMHTNGYQSKTPASSKVVAFSPTSSAPKSKKSSAEELIPFGDDAPPKVGNLNGF